MDLSHASDEASSAVAESLDDGRRCMREHQTISLTHRVQVDAMHSLARAEDGALRGGEDEGKRNERRGEEERTSSRKLALRHEKEENTVSICRCRAPMLSSKLNDCKMW